MGEESRHLPVLLPQAIEFLNCRPGGIYVDGTLGGGGHARAVLEKSAPSGRLIGLDWDGEAVLRARERLAPFGDRVVLVEENFKNLKAVLKSLSLDTVDGILLDLGISTDQLEDPERGFSFRGEGPLDMRMSLNGKTTAGKLLNRLSVPEMEGILREFGEERWARRIAKAVALRQKTTPLRTTRDLAEVIERSVPGRGRIHPATRTFQALRVAVNDELENLSRFFDQAPALLNPKGRLVVISFHSLEDRIVKTHFRQKATWRALTPKPLVPAPEEFFSNPRARSAKLRAAERLAANMEEGGSNGGSDL